MTAHRLNVLDKGVDSYTDPGSGAGKSTLANLMSWAAPGLIKVFKVKDRQTWSNQEWSEINVELTSRRVTIIDEAGLVHVSRDTIVEMTQEDVPVEVKHVQPYMATRQGTAILLGADYHWLDGSSQGVLERIGQTAESKGKPAPDGIYDRLRNNVEAHRLMAWILLTQQAQPVFVQNESAKAELVKRSLFSPASKFVYAALEPTGNFTDKVDLQELGTHPLLKPYGLSESKVRLGILKAITHVYRDGEPLPQTEIEKEKNAITAIRGFKIRWGGWL